MKGIVTIALCFTIWLISCSNHNRAYTYEFAYATPFCDGWADGYSDGYCQNDQFCTTPWIPTCPYPGANEVTYKHGYNNGFTAGKNKRDDI